MNIIDRLNWIDIAVQMQLMTMEMGKVRVVCSPEIIKWDQDGNQDV